MYDYSRVETSLDYYYDAEAAITSYCTIDYILDIRSMDKPQILEVVSFQITKLMYKIFLFNQPRSGMVSGGWS